MPLRPHPLQPACIDSLLLFATVEILGVQAPEQEPKKEASEGDQSAAPGIAPGERCHGKYYERIACC